MNVPEREQFLDAMRETARLIKLSQAALERARSQCHGKVYEQVDLMTKRVYELRVKSEWLRHAVQEGIELSLLGQDDPEGRQDPDRRIGIDRRIHAMRQQLFPVLSPQAEAQARLSSQAQRRGPGVSR